MTSTEGKKLHQKTTQGLTEEQKHEFDPKDITNFMERIQSKSEDFGWDTVTTNIGTDDLNIFETPGK